MSSLYIRVRTGFYAHRKTAHLRLLIGDAAFWLPPRMWAYCAENQPDGDLSSYPAELLASLLAYQSNAQAMLEALKVSGFVDSDGFVHDWEEHNGFHQSFAKRAKTAAEARWGKNRKPSICTKIGEMDMEKETSIAKCMLQASEPVETPAKGYHRDTRAALHILNESCGRFYREVDANLKIISARLSEPGVDIDGVRQMIRRQCELWKGTDYGKYLRPETLFRQSKFDGYYAARAEPATRIGGSNNHRNDGFAGGADEGKAQRVLARRAAEAAAQSAAKAPMAGQVAGPRMHVTGHPKVG